MANEHERAAGGRGLALIIRVGLRLVGFAALWLALTRGQFLEAWYIGAAALVLATAASYWIAPGFGVKQVRPMGLLRFVPYFVRRSVVGAVDIARRAFSPSRPLAPQLVEHPLRIHPTSSAAIAFVGIISLLPGTLCAGLSESGVTVHVVDRSWPIHEQLAELEEKVAAIFGEPLVAIDDEQGGAL